MVEDRTNQVFTDLLQYLESYYSNISGGTAYPDKAPSFPYLYFFQLDASTALTTLSNTEDGVDTAYQIEVYSDKSMNHARKIANTVREYMIGEGYRCINFMPSQAPTSVKRFVMRYGRLDV